MQRSVTLCLLLQSFIAIAVAFAFKGNAISTLHPHHHVPLISPLRAESPAYGLYEVQEEMLVKRGRVEEKLMEGMSKPLLANASKGMGGGRGFGSGSLSEKSNFKQDAKSHRNVIRKEGVVRVDNVLSDDLADNLRKFVFAYRKESEELVEAGSIKSSDRFASVLLKQNRCDLKLPLGDTRKTKSPVIEALYHVLFKSPVGESIAAALSDQCVLYELSCLISDPGSDRQVVHPDNPCVSGRVDPTLLTCFIALQDIDVDMGPTVFLPRTHSEKIHSLFQDETVGETGSPKDKLLRTSKSVLSTLEKGSCSIFDSRLLHCGGANKSQESRAIFYFSFRSPQIAYPGNPASIKADLASALISLETLKENICAIKEKGAINTFSSD